MGGIFLLIKLVCSKCGVAKTIEVPWCDISVRTVEDTGLRLVFSNYYQYGFSIKNGFYGDEDKVICNICKDDVVKTI